MASRFTTLKLENTQIIINTHSFRSTKFVEEKYHEELNGIKALFEGVKVDSDDEIMIKLRIQSVFFNSFLSSSC
jgi:hypothetical protein